MTINTPYQIEPLPPERRRAILSQVIADNVRIGWRVEAQSDYQVVLAGGSAPNHVLHLLLTVFTLGLWLIPWVIIALTQKVERTVFTVDEWGNVSRT